MKPSLPRFVDAGPERLYFAGGGLGIWVSADEGQTWGASLDSLPRLLPGEPSVTAFHAEPGDGRELTVLADSLYVRDAPDAPWRDAGQIFDSPVLDLRQSPWTERALYAVTRTGIWRSVDRGSSFEHLSVQTIEHGRARLRFDPPRPGRVFLIAAHRLLVSDDAGVQWRDISEGLTGRPLFYDVASDPEAPDVIYAATPWGLYRTLIQGATAVVASGFEPITFGLDANYPNPFNPATVIGYDLADAGAIQLRVYNVLGQQVRTLIDHDKPAGAHTVVWDGRDDDGHPLASGVYIYRLTSSRDVLTRRMVLIR